MSRAFLNGEEVSKPDCQNEIELCFIIVCMDSPWVYCTQHHTHHLFLLPLLKKSSRVSPESVGASRTISRQTVSTNTGSTTLIPASESKIFIPRFHRLLSQLAWWEFLCLYFSCSTINWLWHPCRNSLCPSRFWFWK